MIGDVAAMDYPGTSIRIADVDVADWIEQQQTVPLPDDEYPYQCSLRSTFERMADWSCV
jgi:hypothetical protein